MEKFVIKGLKHVGIKAVSPKTKNVTGRRSRLSRFENHQQ